MNTNVEVLEIALKVTLVVHPRHTVHSRSGVLSYLKERFLEQSDVNVMEECGELLRPLFLSDSSYAAQFL